MTSGETLAALVATLEQIQDVLPKDMGNWHGQPLVRLAIERLWITAGNLAESYRVAQNIASGVEPWSELAGYRNLLAHALPGDISSDRVFADSSDLGRILAELRSELPRS